MASDFTVKELEAIIARTEEAIRTKQGSTELMKPLISLRESATKERSVTKLHVLPTLAAQHEETILEALSKGDKDDGDGPVIVKTKTVNVKASMFSKKTYLETETEVEDFIARLKTELMGIVHRQDRARIQ